MEIIYGIEDVAEVAKKIITHSSGKTVLFIGELGAGKTTLIKAIVHQLGSTDRVSSPTFSLVNEYQGIKNKIYHFDFYRIEDEEEAYDIGFEEYLQSDAWKLIEWPQVIEHMLSNKKSTVQIEKLDNQQRKIIIN